MRADNHRKIDALQKRADDGCERSQEILDTEFGWSQDMPEIVPYDMEMIYHFMELGTERRLEGCFIPVSSIRNYGRDILNLDDDGLDSFTYLMRELDKYSISRAHEKRKKQQREQEAKSKRGVK